jgi:hypothetical protein
MATLPTLSGEKLVIVEGRWLQKSAQKYRFNGRKFADCTSVRHIEPNVGKLAPRKVRRGDRHHQVFDISAREQREMVRRQLKKHDGLRLPLDELRAPASRLTT